MKKVTFATAATWLSVMVALSASSPASAQTVVTGRSIAIDQKVGEQHVRPSQTYLIDDDLGDAPPSLYAARPQRGRNGR